MSSDEGVLPAMTIFLDPGKTTGWAYYTENGHFHSGEDEFIQLCTQFEMSASIHGSALWVGWEQFIINSQTAGRQGSEDSLEVIGAIKYIAYKYECTILPARTSSSRNLGSLHKLKRIGWHTPGKGHANDAAQHLLSYAIENHVLPDDLLTRAVMGNTDVYVAGI